jgi:hypothetical protein
MCNACALNVKFSSVVEEASRKFHNLVIRGGRTMCTTATDDICHGRALSAEVASTSHHFYHVFSNLHKNTVIMHRVLRQLLSSSCSLMMKALRRLNIRKETNSKHLRQQHCSVEIIEFSSHARRWKAATPLDFPPDAFSFGNG